MKVVFCILVGGVLASLTSKRLNTNQATLEESLLNVSALSESSKKFLSCQAVKTRSKEVENQLAKVEADKKRAMELLQTNESHILQALGMDVGVLDTFQPTSFVATADDETVRSYAKLAHSAYAIGKQVKVGIQADDEMEHATQYYAEEQKAEAIIHQIDGFQGYQVQNVLARHGNQFSAIILYNPLKRHLIINFKGTTGPFLRSEDWLHNFQYGKVSVPSVQMSFIDVGAPSEASGRVVVSNDDDFVVGLTVFKGFYELAKGHLEEVANAIGAIVVRQSGMFFINEEGKVENTFPVGMKITTVGHSLGGALSLLLAYHCKNTLIKRYGKAFEETSVVENISFAAPAIFDARSASIVEKVLGRDQVLRLFNRCDRVPCTDYYLDYAHVGVGMPLDSSKDPEASADYTCHKMPTYIATVQNQYPSIRQFFLSKAGDRQLLHTKINNCNLTATNLSASSSSLTELKEKDCTVLSQQDVAAIVDELSKVTSKASQTKSLSARALKHFNFMNKCLKKVQRQMESLQKKAQKRLSEVSNGIPKPQPAQSQGLWSKVCGLFW